MSHSQFAQMDQQAIIDHLKLEPHVEGGYFRRIYQAEETIDITAGQRRLMTSIYYLLTSNSPRGYLHKNRSDIMHYYLGGAPLKYLLLYPNGSLQEVILGHNLAAGQQLSFLVQGGCWKASELTAGEYGLVAEAVCPGFEYADMELAKSTQIMRQFPDKYPLLQRYIKAD